MARAPLTMAGIKPLRIVGGKTAGAAFAVSLDQKSLARGRKVIDNYQGMSLYVRMQKATLAAAKVLEAPVKAAAPVSHDKDPGQMKKSTRARPAKVRTAYISGKGWRSKASSEAIVGPRTHHSHLAIRGHKIVTHTGRFTGRMSRKNPYVDAVAARLYRQAVAEMRRYIFETRS